MGQALFRPLVAFVLLAGFLARAGGLELAHRCPASGAATQAGRHGEHGHRQLPGGTDRCECVGQSCVTLLGVPPARGALAVPRVRLAASTPAVVTDQVRPAVSHLLPFAQAPPA
ncbi:MAG TPA: hypothetical protein VFT84_00425 [Gemmatimonadales bacterium]|nr:hypothetical protein [Gemmatimonadales bacterium]